MVTDIKHEVLLYFVQEYGVDLRKYPEEWEKIYDIFKNGQEKQLDIKHLMQHHLIEGNEIGDKNVLEILIQLKRVIDALVSKVG